MRGGSTFAILLPALQLVLLPATIRGKMLRLGKAGDDINLPCKASVNVNMDFAWKQPDQVVILKGLKNGLQRKMIGPTNKGERVDSSTNEWDRGSFPLKIKRLEMSDSGTYFCEVENKKHEVQLLVFKVTAKPKELLVSGSNLTLTLHTPVELPSLKVEWTGPGDKSKMKLSQNNKTFSLFQLGPKEDGLWNCNIFMKDQSLKLSIRVTVVGFTSPSQTLYQMMDKAAHFSFPLNRDLNNEQLNGELKWQLEGAASPHSAKFSWNDGGLLSLGNGAKFKLSKGPPFKLTVAPVLLAGSGVLSLESSLGTLIQNFNLVVMKAVFQEVPSWKLCCDVQGPIIPGLTLRWLLENQTEKSQEISKEQRKLEVNKLKDGMWKCQLLSGDQELLTSDPFKLKKTEMNQSFLLGISLGAGVGLLLLLGFCVFCCARRRHRLRRAERMSQIRRLLSEKKTCQCPHRF